jgi:hypothetical protein
MQVHITLTNMRPTLISLILLKTGRERTVNREEYDTLSVLLVKYSREQ